MAGGPAEGARPDKATTTRSDRPKSVKGVRTTPAKAPRKRAKGIDKRKKGAVLLGVLVALVTVGAVSFYFVTESPLGAEVGDCIEIAHATSERAELGKVDCAGPEAAFRVAKKFDTSATSCPDPIYLAYREAGRGAGFTLCLALNAAEGDCFTGWGEENPGLVRKVDCSAGPRMRVLAVVRGESEAGACASVEGAGIELAYPEPAMVVCAESVTP